MGSNYAHFLLIFETEPAVEFRRAPRLSAPVFSGNHLHAGTCRFGTCPTKFLANAHEGQVGPPGQGPGSEASPFLENTDTQFGKLQQSPVRTLLPPIVKGALPSRRQTK